MTTSCMASLFLTGFISGATLCGWNHVNHHLAVCRVHHPSITFRWHYPCGVCHHVWSRPAIPEDLCWCWQSDGGHKRGRQWLRGTHIDISISVAVDLFEFLYFSDRLNVTLKSSASLKVAMIVSEPADIWNQFFVSKTSQQKSNCMRLLRMKQWFSIWASLRRQISNLAMFFFRRSLLSEGTFFSRHGDDLRPKCHPFLLGHASHMLDVKCFWSWLDSMAILTICHWNTSFLLCLLQESHPVGCEATDLHMSSLHRAGCFALALGRCHLPQGCWPEGWVSRSWSWTLSHLISLRLPVESPDTSAAHRTVAR